MPPGYGRSGVFWSLVRDGPQTYDELGQDGGLNPEQRMMYDIRTFQPHAVHAGTTPSIPQTADGIVYLNEYHDELVVLRRWLETNKDVLLENAHFTAASLDTKTKGPFREAWHELRERDEFDWIPESPKKRNSGGDQYPDSQTCPMCGKEIETAVPHHMRKGECDGVGY